MKKGVYMLFLSSISVLGALERGLVWHSIHVTTDLMSNVTFILAFWRFLLDSETYCSTW